MKHILSVPPLIGSKTMSLNANTGSIVAKIAHSLVWLC